MRQNTIVADPKSPGYEVMVPVLSIVLRLEATLRNLQKPGESSLSTREIRRRTDVDDEFSADPTTIFHFLHEGTRFPENWKHFLLFPLQHDTAEGTLIYFWCDVVGTWKVRSISANDDVHFGTEAKYLRVKFIL